MKKSPESNRILLTTLVIFFLGVTLYNIGLGPVNGAGILYCAMVLYWTHTVSRRPVSPSIRRRLYGISALMLFLLSVRTLRYFFTGSLSEPWLHTLWYLYYLPFTAIPLLALDAAFLVWNGRDRRPGGMIKALYAFCAALNLVILTNDLHGWAFIFGSAGRQSEQGLRYNYGPVYYAAVCWIVVCTAATLLHLFRENRTAGGSKTPRSMASILFLSALYFAAYYLGTLPALRGRRVLQLPEAYCMFFICLMEACLQAGWFPMQLLRKKESEVRESTAIYERKNRLYEAMVSAVAPQLTRIEGILALREEDEVFRTEMAKACVLTAYIKRRCNLVLMADAQGALSPEDLRLAIAESLEYLRLCGVTGAVFLEGGETVVPGAALVRAYDAFEELGECAMEGAEALLVNIRCAPEGIALRLTLEQPAVLPTGVGVSHSQYNEEDRVLYLDRWIPAEERTAPGPADTAGEQASPARASGRGAEDLPSRAEGVVLPVRSESLRDEESWLTREFTALGSMITANTIEKEKLHARIRLHDDLGKLLLLGRRYVQGKGDRESMLAVWRDSASILEEEGRTEAAESGYAYMREVARDVGIRLEISGPLPEEPGQEEVVVSAIHECMTNTIRHAHGDVLRVASGDGRIEITNNGAPPSGPIVESGGLGMLRGMAEAVGIRMEVESAPEFRLTLLLPSP